MWKMPKSEFLRQIATELLVVLMFLGFTLYAFRNYMVEGVVGEDYIWGGDGMAHVYKITELVTRMKQGVYVDWSDSWYLGYHPYHFYAPLSYVIYACIAFLVNDIGLGIRIGVALSFLISLVGMYLAAMEITSQFRVRKAYRHVVSIVVAVYYAYHPYTVNSIHFAGLLPAAFAFSFLPIPFYFYLRSVHHGGLVNHASCSVFLAATFLAHPYPGFFAASAIGLHFIIGLILSREEQRYNVRKGVASLFGIALFFLGLVAFWIIPYYYEQEVLAQTSGYEWTIPITSVELMSFFDPSMKSVWSPPYLGISAISVLILGFFNRERLSGNLTYAFMLTIAIYLALGVNAPLNSLNPLLHLGVFPDRAIVLCVFCLACGLASAGGSLFEWVSDVGSSLRGSAFTLGFCMILILSTLDSSSIAPTIGLSNPIPGFYDVCHFIREQGVSDGRVLFIGPHAPSYSYSPALTGRDFAGGYYLQGSKLAYETEYCVSFALTRNEITYALRKYEEFNVEYVVVDVGSLGLMTSVLETETFRRVYENDQYVVYKFLRYRGIVQAAFTDIFVVGQSYPSLVVKSVLEGADYNTTVTVGYSPYVDDYRFEELLSHEALVLYSFTFHNKEVAESLLRNYVNAGKLLVVDMDESGPPVIQGDFLGVQFTRQVIRDGPRTESWGAPFDVTYSVLLVNNSFSEGIYNDGPWHAVTYDGFTKILLEVNGRYNVVGIRDNVYFVGLNLFYHALLYNNLAEIELLRQICVPKEGVGKQEFKYQIIKETPSEKFYRTSSKTPVDVLISRAWSPHLQVTVNDRPAVVAIQDGLIRLPLVQGDNYIRIAYVETPIHLISGGITLTTIVLFVVLTVTIKRRKF